MLFIIALVIAVLFSLSCAGALRKHPTPFCIGGAVLSAAVYALSLMHIETPFVREYLLGIFTRGALAGALWVVVMGMRVLPNGSAAVKRLMPVRGELSIFAAAVTLSHIANYGVSYIKRLLMPEFSPAADFVTTFAVSALLVLIMVPLTVISFKKIRSKMNALRWKKLQKAAYVFYALIYIHVMVIFLPRARAGQSGALVSCIAYTAVWSAYHALRVRKWYVTTKKPERKALMNGVSFAAVAAFTGLTAIVGYSAPKDKLTAAAPAKSSAPVVFTAAASSEAPADTDTSAEPAESSLADAVTPTADSSAAPVFSHSEDSSSREPAVTPISSSTSSTASVSRSASSVRTDSSSSSADSSSVSDSSRSDSSISDTSSAAETTTSITTTTVPETTPAPEQTSAAAATQQEVQTAAPETQAVQTAAPETTPAPETTTAPSETTTTTTTTTTAPPAETTTTTIETEPEPEKIYNDGEYTDSAYGYDGYIHVTITIENDRITGFEAYTDEEEQEYFNMAYAEMGQDIIDSNSADVDAVSGATYSSEAIKKAVEKCLEQAKR